jgi:hypothetical protein
MGFTPWARACSRCSMRANYSMSGQLCRACFDERAKAVYWDRDPACNAKGPTKAQCLLPAGHKGEHEGNGFDDYGPIYRCWRTKPTHPTPGKASGDE